MVLGLASWPLAATADSICADLTKMVEGRFEPPLRTAFADQSLCGRSLGLSGRHTYHCRWPFAFRAPEARRQFDDLTVDVLHCLGQGAQQPQEDDVNHPDTYDQRLFLTDRGKVSVALKDKGALQQTFVFLRVEATGAGD